MYHHQKFVDRHGDIIKSRQLNRWKMSRTEVCEEDWPLTPTTMDVYNDELHLLKWLEMS